MSSIAQLRAELQKPRASVDTWYGKNVMRRFSIYITWLFSKLGFSPNTATSLSVVAVFLGAIFLSASFWGLGIFFINLWYLLDHVDGELARFYGRSSASGLFYDTIVNFLVQPLTFFGLGWGLSESFGESYFLFGVLGGFGYLMLSLIPMCEASILLERLKIKGLPKEAANASFTASKLAPGPRSLFAAWHKMILFPNFLMAISAIYFVTALNFERFEHLVLISFLIFYSVSCTVIWAAQLFQKVHSKKIDGHPWIVGKA